MSGMGDVVNDSLDYACNYVAIDCSRLDRFPLQKRNQLGKYYFQINYRHTRAMLYEFLVVCVRGFIASSIVLLYYMVNLYYIHINCGKKKKSTPSPLLPAQHLSQISGRLQPTNLTRIPSRRNTPFEAFPYHRTIPIQQVMYHSSAHPIQQSTPRRQQYCTG